MLVITSGSFPNIKMAPAKTKGELLARVNFPPYTVKMLTNRHVLVAGGGGKARTGIANAIEIYELGFDGKTCRAQPSTRHETGDRAIMNCETFHNGKYYVLAAGMEGSCQIYQLKLCVAHPEPEVETIPEKDSNSSTNLRLRGKSQSIDAAQKPKEDSAPGVTQETQQEDQNCNSVPLMGFNVQALQCVQTDFSDEPDDAFQKVVRVSSDKKVLVTGGASGILRIWEYPEMKQAASIAAHKDEIDDLDLSPSGKSIVTVSRDGHCYLWDLKSHELQCELSWTAPGDEKYRYRNCRFGSVEGDVRNVCLFTSHIPAVRQRKPSPCFLVKWDLQRHTPQKVQSVGTEISSSMAISEDGRFIGLGTLSGNVNIYISFSLQRVLQVEHAHNLFVTGLEFLPTSEDMLQITGGYDTSLISISVDNQIKIHHVPKQVTISVVWVLLLFVVCLFLVFLLMSYLGL